MSPFTTRWGYGGRVFDLNPASLRERKIRYEEKFVSIHAAMVAEISEQYCGPIGEKI